MRMLIEHAVSLDESRYPTMNRSLPSMHALTACLRHDMIYPTLKFLVIKKKNYLFYSSFEMKWRDGLVK